MNALLHASSTGDPAADSIGHDPRWAAIRTRDAAADGSFYYSVETTGVYCRPSCASRPAKPEHVRFHASREDAERAGYRPCLRCRPDLPPLRERQAALVADCCRAIEAASELPRPHDLARRAGLAPGHFNRVFKRITGLTPQAYIAGVRARRLRALLARGMKVTDALAEAGYASTSRFYEQADAVLGMTPGQYRTGRGTVIRFALEDCSLGQVLVAATARGVCAILLGDDPAALVEDLQHRFPAAELLSAEPGAGSPGPESTGFNRMLQAVVAQVAAPALTPAFDLDLAGTLFQQRVWHALRQIPPGRTTDYSALAAALGMPKAARAVASAVAANPLAVVVPCHRVLHRDGTLAGYRWGVARKRALLAREAEQAGTAPDPADPAVPSRPQDVDKGETS